jgi:hypothetical protein
MGVITKKETKTAGGETSIKDVKRCVRCVMPEGYPGITFDAEGVCSACRHFEARWKALVSSPEEQARSEAKLRSIFEAAKLQGKPYDALIGVSGGKDSSYCVYLCKEVYGLNVLTCTRDNGFMSEEGKKRVEKLVKAFKVPHLYYRDTFATELAGIFMRKTGNFCAPCELWSFNIHAMLVNEYDIPLIVMGSSSRTDGAPPKQLNPWDPWYFRNVLKGENFRERLGCSVYARNYVIRQGLAQALGRRKVVLPPDYIDWDEEKIARLFREKYDINFGEEHSDCFADDVKEYLYAKKCGSGPKVVKYSLLIRGGKMSREEALKKLSRIDHTSPPPCLGRFLETVGMTREEFDAASERSPEPYMSSLTKIFNAFRKRIRRQSS